MHFTSTKSTSPVENQNDLELDFKVFFFVDYCWWGIVLDESNWCHSGVQDGRQLGSQDLYD